MICVSIGNTTLKECLAALKKNDFAEVRLDTMNVDLKDVRMIFSRPLRLIATCRPGPFDERKRMALLSEAIAAGASFVDIEIGAGDEFRKDIMAKARRRGCRVICSYHNFKKTPGRADLQRIIARSFKTGADIVKIACRVGCRADNARLLGLLEDKRPMIVLGMGPQGKISRVAAPLLGSPFTYASPAPGKETAEGQMDKKKLEKIFRSFKDA